MQISIAQTLLHRVVLDNYNFVEGGMSDPEMTYLDLSNLYCNISPSIVLRTLLNLTFWCKCLKMSPISWGKQVYCL